MAYHLYLVSSAGETATLRMDILDLEKSICQHKKIVQFQTVPSQYLPKNLAFINHPTKSTINELFLRKYKEVFLQRLATVIEINAVTLELKKARLQVSQKQQATQSTTPPLKPTITTQPNKKTAAYSEQQVTGVKRKQPLLNPQQNKRQKTMDHFLVRGQKKVPRIT